MKQIRIEANCRILTPMLSSGANQQDFEIRPTALKSALRFWWRAFQPDDSRLGKDEAKLFGNTDGAGPFRVRILNENVTTWKPGNPHGWGFGVQYMLFAINAYGNPAKIKPTHKGGRPVAQPDGTFTIRIDAEPGKANGETITDILAALWLVEHFGGLGGRTRRCAGAFEITGLQTKGCTIPKELAFGGNHPGKPEQILSKGLRFIMDRWNTGQRKQPPGYTAYCADRSKILVMYNGQGNNALISAQNIMDRVGNAMKNFCDTNPHSEAKKMHDALSKKIPLPAKFQLTKAAKGLPIIYNFTNNFEIRNSRRMGKTYQATTVEVDNGGNPIENNGKFKQGTGRRASPLLISCHRVGTTPYAVFCHFPAPLIPKNEKILLKTDNSELCRVCPAPGNDFVLDLLKNRVPITPDHGAPFEKKPIAEYFSTALEILPKPGKVLVGKASEENGIEPPPSPKPPKQDRLPEQILNDPKYKGKVFVQLKDDPQIGQKVLKGVRIDPDGAQDTGETWTLTKKSLKIIPNIKKGDLLVGEENPGKARRLMNPEKAV